MINILADPSKVSRDLRIRNTQNHHTEFFQIFGTKLIGSAILWFIMLRAIQLNHQLRFGTIEIHYEFPEYSLPTELDRMMPQIVIPQMSLFLCHFSSEVSCICNQLMISSIVHRSPSGPKGPPPPFGCAKQGRLSSLFQFPLVDLHGLFVELEIALVAAFADVACGQGRGDGAAGLFSVGAVAELALT